MKPYYTIGAKELGGILIAIAVILALVFVSATREMTSAADSACACGADGISTCPHAKGIPFQSYLGFSLAIVLGGLGGFMVLNGLNYQKEVSEKSSKREKEFAALAEDEKRLCEITKGGGGAVFQSELVEKSGFTKVKVTRILDKLEGKGLIERRRRGMTNLVLLK